MRARRILPGVVLSATLCALAAPMTAAAAAGDATRATASLRSAFPELARAPRAPGVPDGAGVAEYVGRDMARLVGAKGRREVLVSSMPLRSRVGDGSLQPLSLQLRSGGPGEVRPQNPVAEVRIATDPRQGFQIGPDARHLVKIVPLGLRPDAPNATAFAGQLLFAGARDGADLLIRPAVDGVQTFEQLNAAAAPESFSYRLELGPDQTARLAGASVTVHQGDRIVARSLPPVAVDADHHAVPLTTSLRDGVLRLDVAHRDRGFAYPIAVDPDWISSYDYVENPGIGLQGWHVRGQAVGGEGPGIYYDALINTVFDPDIPNGEDALGFFIKPIGAPGGRTFPIGVGATLFFNAPGSTHIRSVTYDDVVRRNDTDRQTLRLGLYGASFGEADDVFETNDISTRAVRLPTTPFATDRDTPANSAVMWMYTSPCDAGIDRNCPPSIDSTTSRTLLRVGSVQLVLTDFDFPATQAPGTLRDLEDRWTNVADSRTLDPSATDDGSGVRDLTVTSLDAAGTHAISSIQSPCHPEHDQTDPPQDNAICPQSLGLDQPLRLDTGALPDGRSTFTVDASDLAGNTASAGATATTFSLYLDRHPPATTVAGELRDAADSWIRPQRASTVTVTGADTVGGQGNVSGIAHNRLSAVDSSGAVVLDRDAATCTPAGPIEAPCDPGRASTFTVDPRQLPEGPITFTAHSTDLAGNDSDPVTWTVRLDRTPPAVRATGDLLGLTSQHTNTTAPIDVTLHGRDSASGIQRLSLVASNSDGETVLAERDVCTDANVDAADGSCPHVPTVQVTVAPADLPDGPTTFIARAVDHAGIRSVDDQDWDTYVDHTPPDPPDSVTVTAASTTSVTVSWPAVVDQPLGSGGLSYEYLVQAGGQPIGAWRPTTNPYGQATGLPPGTSVEVLVRAVDAAKNTGKAVAGRGTTFRAVSASAAATTVSVEGRFQPILHQSSTDGFLPIDFDWALRLRNKSDHQFTTTVREKGSRRFVRNARFPLPPFGDATRFLSFPYNNPGATSLGHGSRTRALENLEEALDAHGVRSQRATTREYTYLGRKVPAGTAGAGTRTLQYWLYYHYNYFFFHAENVDGHQGDWEHVDLRLNPAAPRAPVSLFMSRHKSGKAYSDPVNNPLIRMSGTHPHVYPATGTHAIYEKCNGDPGFDIKDPSIVDASGAHDHTCEGRQDTLDDTVPLTTMNSAAVRRKFACWGGRAGAEEASPNSPLMQSKAYGALGDCRALDPPEAGPVRGTTARAAGARSAAATQAEDLSCAGYEQPGGSAGSTTVVACDQAALDAYIRDGVQQPDAAPRLATTDPRFTVSSGAVAEASGPAGTDPSSVSIVVGRSGVVRLFVATRDRQVSFGPVAAPAGTPLTLSTPAGGRWVIRDNAGRVLASAQPTKAAPALRVVRQLKARRTRRVVRVSFAGQEPTGARFSLSLSGTRTGPGHGLRRLKWRASGRYVAHLRARASDRYVRVRVTRGASRTPTQIVRIR